MSYFENTSNDSAFEQSSTLPRNLYFAYGSNMDSDQMMFRCPDSHFMGTALLHGYGLASDSAGYATIVSGLADKVTGALWAVSDEDIVALDRYEGVQSGCYRKEEMTVVRTDAIPEQIEALVYVSERAPFSSDAGNIEYFERVLTAAETVGVDAGTIEQLESIIAASRALDLP